MKKLAALICKREGLKKEVPIAQVREVLSVLSDIIYEERAEFGISKSAQKIFNNGDFRAKRKRV
jgi:hypothetical protein